MNRSEFVAQVSGQVRLVRAEFDLTQEKMALVLGLSKKTLVEIEKGRSSLGWPGTVTLCTLFSDSQVLQNAYGGELSDLLRALAFQHPPKAPRPTMGGRVWWRELRKDQGWRVQQNLVSQHYRILDPEDGRLFSSFDWREIEAFWNLYGPGGAGQDKSDASDLQCPDE